MTRIIPALFLVFLTAFPAFSATRASRETPVVRAVAAAVPAVVNISTEIETRRESPFGGDPFFEKFFRDFYGDSPGTWKGESLGSGVVVDAEGRILTNEHVIRNASRIVVTFSTGETREARLVGADARTDLAVLKVEGKANTPHIGMGRSDDLMIGETVIAIGNPFGLSHTVTTGVVSAVNRTIKGGDGRTYSDFIQIDASINPGNSGGPLLNIAGELIGINAAIYQSAEGIGFAIPIDKARRIMNDLIHFGEVHRAFVGLQVQDVDEDLAGYYKLKKAEGVLVSRVFEGGPAQKAGIRRGDILTAIDSQPLRSRTEYSDRLAGFTADSRISFTVRSGEGEKTVTVSASQTPKGYGRELARDWLGVEVEKNTSQSARRYKLATGEGVVVTRVVKGSASDELGMKPGDVIRSVNDADTDDEESFYTSVLNASMRETVVLVVQRGRVAYYVTVNP